MKGGWLWLVAARIVPVLTVVRAGFSGDCVFPITAEMSDDSVPMVEVVGAAVVPSGSLVRTGWEDGLIVPTLLDPWTERPYDKLANAQ